MNFANLNSPPEGLCALLRGVLKDAAQTVPEAKRTPSVMACLAEKILTLAANGTTDPISLRRIALERLQESCKDCCGCEGLQLVHHSQPVGNNWSSSVEAASDRMCSLTRLSLELRASRELI
jgi:hypothetical protein